MDNTHSIAPEHGDVDAAGALRGRINRELAGQTRVPDHVERVTLDKSL